ncbi:MAG: hypothetical protein AAGA60_09710 [Cyanobacteria bacterium P01_E01_bin.42]
MRSSCFQKLFGYLPYSLGAVTFGIAIAEARPARAFGFIFSNFNQPRVTHQIGYNGTGGHYTIDVGIDASSLFAPEMIVATQNVINTWNNLVPTVGNLDFSEISGSQMDFESVLLHELGHSLGLAHPNLASESGTSGARRNYTKATTGANGTYDLNPGADGIIGSGDDLRGDDENRNFFRIADNDPFATDLGIVDSTTYSRDISLLPVGNSYSANGDRDVGAALGYANTEAVMQQGAFFGEIQRSLSADDAAGILYALAGVDEIAGTADDYTFELNFLGLTDAADILIDFDNSETGFAVSQSSGRAIGTNTTTGNQHYVITRSNIFFNSDFNWFFSETETLPVPDPPIVPEPPVVTDSQSVPDPSFLLGLLAVGAGGFFCKRKPN